MTRYRQKEKREAEKWRKMRKKKDVNVKWLAVFVTSLIALIYWWFL